MIPMSFKEANRELKKPDSMTDEECGSLCVFSDGEQCVSKWKMSWKERLFCLFFGYVWVYILSGKTQPPIFVDAKRTAFRTETGD